MCLPTRLLKRSGLSLTVRLQLDIRILTKRRAILIPGSMVENSALLMPDHHRETTSLVWLLERLALVHLLVLQLVEELLQVQLQGRLTI